MRNWRAEMIPEIKRLGLNIDVEVLDEAFTRLASTETSLTPKQREEMDLPLGPAERKKWGLSEEGQDEHFRA